jgi:hypothetical protein
MPSGSVRRSSLHLGVALGLLAAAGCCRFPAPVRAFPPPEPRSAHTFSIVTEGGCPVDAVIDVPNCPSRAKDCVALRRGESLTFRTSPPVDFEIHLDPFSNPVRSREGVATITVDRERHPKHAQPYPFTIQAKGCKPHDPIIIVTEW